MLPRYLRITRLNRNLDVSDMKRKIKQMSLILIFLAAAGLLFPLAQPAAKQVTDQSGRQMTVPDNPQRIVSLVPSITEIIFALGQEHRLKGATQFSDFPPEAKQLPRVGSYVRLDLEKIVALKPDLCFATKDGNPKDTVKRLASLGIPVYVVDPRDLNSTIQAILKIGDILNATQRANTIASEMRSRIKRVKSLVAKSTHRPRVFFQIGISPIVSVGTPTFIHELILVAGGKNVAEGPAPYPRFNREQVLALSPEVLIITSMARGASFEQIKDEWSRWPSLPAVRNNRILLVDSNLFDRPTPRLVDALELLAGLINPELFEGQK
jgi:iron complex transport system substrate-binding protein